MMRTLSKLAATGALLFAGSQAQAIMITDWIHNPDSEPANYTLSVEEIDMGNTFKFTLSVDGGFNADLLALGFNINEGMSAPYSDANINEMGSDIDDVFYSTNSCGSGCNFNGGTGPGSFDVIIRLLNGGASDPLTSTMFTIASLGLSLDDFTNFGIRGLSTGDDQEGSDKAFGATADMPVSEATSVAMLGMGLLGLGLVGRMRRSS